MCPPCPTQEFPRFLQNAAANTFSQQLWQYITTGQCTEMATSEWPVARAGDGQWNNWADMEKVGKCPVAEMPAIN